MTELGRRPGPGGGHVSAGERDQIFDGDEAPAGPFVFDDQVARVFPDMVSRSVPGYGEMVGLIGLIARHFARPGTRCYDLGCSLGAVTAVLLTHTDPTVSLIAVDNAAPMLDGLRGRLGTLPGFDQPGRLTLVCDDVRTHPIDQASLVVLNLTLQFIPPESRLALLTRIRAGLVPGGALVLVEKVRLAEDDGGALLGALHADFKRAQGYSELAITRKRAALELVLVPDAIAEHEARLADAGFAGFTRWYQALGFVAWLAWT